MLLGTTVVREATGEVGVTGSTPTLQIGFFLPVKNTDKRNSRYMNILFSFKNLKMTHCKKKFKFVYGWNKKIIITIQTKTTVLEKWEYKKT